MLNQLFKDESLNEKFYKEGFLYLNKNILDSELINEILENINNSLLNIKNYNKQIHTIDTKEKEVLKQFSTFIEKTIDKQIKEIFNDVEFVFSMIVSKPPNSKDILHLHQDASFIDEDIKDNFGITFWIPLVDVNLNNGCIGLIKKSHKIYDSICPLPFPDVYTPLWKHSFSLFPYCTFIEMKAGEALIFNSKLFHGALPNFTNNTRYALSIWLSNKKEDNCFYYLKPGTKNRLLKYKINKDFYYKYDNNILHEMFINKQTLEDYKIVCESDYIYKDYTGKQIIQEVVKLGNRFDNNIYEILSKYFYHEINPNIFSKVLNKLKQKLK